MHVDSSTTLDSRIQVNSSATKNSLLVLAKAAIERGNNAALPSWREAAELIAQVQEQHGASVREIAKAIGMSRSWVNSLLAWQRRGFVGDGPFSAQSTVRKVARAAARAARKKSPKLVRSPETPEPAEFIGIDELEPEPDTSVADRKALYAATETEPAELFDSEEPDARQVEDEPPAPTESAVHLAEFRFALRQRFLQMNDADVATAKSEVAAWERTP
jgi:hypothetical protein